MSIFKNVNDETEMIVTCNCGCDEGLRFKVDKLDHDYYCVMTYMWLENNKKENKENE